jgi:hypothetical protein
MLVAMENDGLCSHVCPRTECILEIKTLLHEPNPTTFLKKQ